MEYYLFKYFWLLALMPKYVQLIILSCNTFFLLYKKNFQLKIRKDGISIAFAGYLLIYALSIIFATLTTEHEISRIMAAGNTFIVTFISLVTYELYDVEEIDYNRISKYAMYNICILTILSFIYLYYGVDRLVIFSRRIGGADWINGVKTTRFSAFLEYTNLVVYMYLYMMPISIAYAKKRFVNIMFIFYVMAPILPLYLTNSRMGVPIVIVMSLLILINHYFRRIRMFVINNKKIVILLGLILLFLLFIIFKNRVYDILNMMISRRQGSSDTRMQLYSVSIQRWISESPIIGCGIKDIWYGVPYGSHSTYLGVFYKSGFIGGIIFLFGMIYNVVRRVKTVKADENSIILVVGYIFVLLVSVLEDLDGADWNIYFFMIYMSFVNSYKFTQKSKAEISNG